MSESYVAARPPTTTTPANRRSMLAAFTDRGAALGVTVVQVADSDAAAGEVASIASRLNVHVPLLSAELAHAAPHLCAALAARGAASSPPGNSDETNDAPLGLSLAHLAVAETGSVLLAEQTLPDRGIGLLVREQLVVCPTSALVATLDDAAPVLRSFSRQPGGAYSTLVTGPSRTADIERALTVGVQGPAKLSVLFVDDLT